MIFFWKGQSVLTKTYYFPLKFQKRMRFNSLECFIESLLKYENCWFSKSKTFHFEMQGTSKNG